MLHDNYGLNLIILRLYNFNFNIKILLINLDLDLLCRLAKKKSLIIKNKAKNKNHYLKGLF